MPVRPFGHPADALGARPREAFAPHADAVAHCLAVAEHEIEEGVRRIDDDRSCRFVRRIVDELPLQVGRQLLRPALFRAVVRRKCRVAVAGRRRFRLCSDRSDRARRRLGRRQRDRRQRPRDGPNCRSTGSRAVYVTRRTDRFLPVAVCAGGVAARLHGTLRRRNIGIAVGRRRGRRGRGGCARRRQRLNLVVRVGAGGTGSVVIVVVGRRAAIGAGGRIGARRIGLRGCPRGEAGEADRENNEILRLQASFPLRNSPQILLTLWEEDWAGTRRKSAPAPR